MSDPCPPSADSVSVIDSCPMNLSKWNQRALLKNCSMYPQTCTKPLEYHCLLNPYANESLEVCAPNTWLAEDFCPSYNIREQRILEQFNCTSLISDCPRRQFFSRSILDYGGCLKELHDFHGSTTFKPSTSNDNEITNGNTQWVSIAVEVILALIAVVAVIAAVVCCWKKRLLCCRESRRNEEYKMQVLGSGQRGDVTQHSSTTGNHQDMETSYIKDLFREWQREDKFFVSTRACKEIERQIKTKNFVVVAGHSGYGKSAIVHHIAVDYRAKRWYVKPVEKVDEIKEAYRNEDFRKGETLFVLNDPFGKHVLDELEYRHWKNFEKELVRFLDTHTVKLLLTCRKCIIDEMRDSISSRVFEERSIVYVDGNDFKLSRTEKRTIFKRYSPDEEGVDEKKIDDIIEIDNYFPLLCKLYASRKNQEETNTSLFKEPINFFSEEIENYRRNSKEIYCALACLVFFNNKVCLEDLKNQENQARFTDCLKICNISIYTEPCQIIRSLESLVGKFV
uniref:Uncharacterized protein LOC111105620 isoform X2 n=1 Tax=Crassostrea virginica TaxID=6565 RepID=A0A8B8AX40_CRAVI|nr:uncharacterized protein LOC111105620 isoform X2 [Crassostrea virginica]